MSKRRPSSLLFGRDDSPPTFVSIALGSQHAAFAIVFLAYAVLIGREASFTISQQMSLVVGTLVGCGFGTVLQSGSRRYGAGLLLTSVASPTLIPFLIAAGSTGGPGGIALVVGIAGAVQLMLAPFIIRSRAFFPPEVCGVATVMLGFTLVQASLRQLHVDNIATTPDIGADFTICVVTFGSILASTVWLKGNLRFFALIFGGAIGYSVAALLGRLSNLKELADYSALFAVPSFSLPTPSIEASMIPMIILLSVVSAIYSIAVFINTDRLDDADWVRPDLKQLSRGVWAMGVANLVSSVVGGAQIGISSSGVGLAYATGVTSRIVGVCGGVLLLVFSLSPKALTFMIAVPNAVLSGVLAFVAMYLVVSGFQLALLRMMSPRRLIVIGAPVCLGVGLLAHPVLSQQLGGIAGALVQSPLAAATLLAVLLNTVLRLGISQKITIVVYSLRDEYLSIRQTLMKQGELWGLKAVTVEEANRLISELVEAVRPATDEPLQFEIRHDDLYLDVELSYRGPRLAFPDRAPTAEEMLEDPDAVERMAGWLLRHLSSRIRQFRRNDMEVLAFRVTA